MASFGDHFTRGYTPSILALAITVSFGYLILFTPILSPSDQNSHYHRFDRTLHALAFSSTTFTYFLGITDLLLRVAKPTSAIAERLSVATLSATGATLILYIFLALKVALLDSLGMWAVVVRGGGGGGGEGGGGGPIEAAMNFVM